MSFVVNSVSLRRLSRKSITVGFLSVSYSEEEKEYAHFGNKNKPNILAHWKKYLHKINTIVHNLRNFLLNNLFGDCSNYSEVIK